MNFYLINKKNTLLSAGLALAISFSSCTEEEPEPPKTSYEVPSSYNFSNVDYSGQTIRLIMLDSLSNYMKRANSGAVLDAGIMKNMYANAGNPFNNAELDGSDKQLKSKTFSLDQMYFDDLFDSLAVASQSSTEGSNGVAGIVSNGSKSFLLNRNGVEYTQLITKQLMGGVFYFQAVEHYLTNLPTVDNNNVEEGKGTAMEHYCDEAFGYFGIPIDFPTNTSGLKYWGSYADKVNDKIDCNTPLMNAFLKLRAAISNKDNTTRDAQIITVREEWERVVAASAILELSKAKTAFSDDAERTHLLSEALGFIAALKYNSNKKINQTEIEMAIEALGNNFYEVSVSDINNAINIINDVYDFDLTKF